MSFNGEDERDGLVSEVVEVRNGRDQRREGFSRQLDRIIGSENLNWSRTECFIKGRGIEGDCELEREFDIEEEFILTKKREIIEDNEIIKMEGVGMDRGIKIERRRREEGILELQ